MALLQIAEPGQGGQPHQRKMAVGIDLGTTNSLVATLRSGEAVVLPDEQGHSLLPSVVRYLEGGLVEVGEKAYVAAADDPLNTIVSVKRLMGRGVESSQHLLGTLPYKFVLKEGGMPFIETVAGEKSPVEISAQILAALGQRAERSLGGELDGAVITVPAYFDDAQRQATKDAALLSGINLLRLLNEPTAAAVAYGLDQKQEGVIAVYDLGGGTFDISVLRLSRGVFEVLSTGGDSALGGDDFDQALAAEIASKVSLGANLNASTARTLMKLAREIKEYLSANVECEKTFVLNQSTFTVSFTQDEFSELIKPLVNRSIRACRRALKDASVTVDEVSEVVLVGGSTRVPLVMEAVEQFFKRPPHANIDPDRVVAIGAALQADVLVGNKPDSDMLLLDVIPLSLGIETMGGLVEKLVHRNTPIPVAKAQEFTTYQDGQTAMAIHVVQGERELVSDCRSLASFVLRGIPPMVAGAAKIRVSFRVDADGLLGVSAKELSTGVESEIQVKPSYGLSDDQIATMLKSSYHFAQEDMLMRNLREQQVEADRLLLAVSTALSADGDRLLSAEEKQVIIAAMTALDEKKQQSDVQAIEDAMNSLSELSNQFAERRMDLTIQQALKGHTVSQIEGVE